MKRRAFSAYALIGALLVAGSIVAPDGRAAGGVWSLLVGLSAVVAIFVGVRLNHTRGARAWYLIALGQLLFVAGAAVSLLDSAQGRVTPGVSAADVLSLAGYPAIGAGLLLMIRARSVGQDAASLIDAAIATTGVAFFSWIFLIQPYIGDGSVTTSAMLLPAVYVLMDVALVAVAARILVGAGLRVVSFSLVGGALLLQLMRDGLSMLGTIDGWYPDGSSVNGLAVLASVAWGLAALHPSMSETTERATGDQHEELTTQRLAVLTVVTLVVPLLMLEQSVRTTDLNIFLMVVASTTLFGLVIARFAGVVTRHDRAKQRESRLREAAADLVATRSRAGIYRVAVETALALSEAEGATATRATLSLGSPDGMTVVASSGVNVDGLVGRHVEHLPAPVREALLTGCVGSFTGPADVGAGGLLAGERLLVIPIVIQGTCRGGLFVRTNGLPHSSQQQGLLTLAAQVGLALESVALSEDLLERESERRFRRLVQNSTDVIVVLESDLTIRFATPSTKTVLGFGSETLVGSNLVSLLQPAETDAIIDLVAALSGDTVNHDFELRCANGGWCPVESVWSDLSADPEVNGIVVTAHDVTEQRQLESQLTHQAFHDPLTGLANRALFTDRVTHALDRAHRSGEQLAVLFVDLDDFKTVNDSLGHAAGDDVLVGVSARLEGCLRGGDTCARLGGDEFGVLLEGVRPPEQAEDVAARISDALASPFEMAGQEVYARASIGVALGSSAASAGELLRNADVAMYRAKSDPTRSVEVFESGMREVALQRLELRADLERAVTAGDFIVHYQPIVALETGRVIGLEALVRWLHPLRGLLEPDTFVPLAEETGLIGRVGALVLDQACHAVAGWQRTVPGAERLRISVNISGYQLEDRTFPAEVGEILDRSGLSPGDLMLELTESVLMGDGEVAVLRLARLKDIGVSIAIDDFGTGFSSLNYLHRFPVDMLKIAKPFVDRVGRGESGRLAAAIVSLGDSLRLETVAEGIEAAEQRDALRALGCALGQGFYFARPMPATETRMYLERRLRAAA
jgi:diguanylate cyclase (GGDEF)-like protein/PAS domain S-box-containing protein